METVSYFSEWLANGRARNQLSITSICNMNCCFCSSKMNTFPVLKNKFRDIDDIKRQLITMQLGDQTIRIGDNLPGRIAEGDALIHPHLIEILEIIRKRFPENLIQATTNGTKLNEGFIKELKKYRPMQITLSLHTTQVEKWVQIFGVRSKEMAVNAINSPLLLKKYNFNFEGNMVILPNICSWDEIRNTFDYLVHNGAKKMVLFHPGFTKITKEEVVDAIHCPEDQFYSFVQEMQAKYSFLNISGFPDINSVDTVPIHKIISLTLAGNSKNHGKHFKNVLWLASEAAYKKLKIKIQEASDNVINNHYIQAVKNNFYGGNIIVGGLLFVEDFILEGRRFLKDHPEIDLILIPEAPFDDFLQDLNQVPAYEIADELNIPVWVISEDGRYNPLLSTPLIAKSSN